jgi:hypothetical protein
MYGPYMGGVPPPLDLAMMSQPNVNAAWEPPYGGAAYQPYAGAAAGSYAQAPMVRAPCVLGIWYRVS